MQALITGLKKIKEQGGKWIDFIENENGLIEKNYEIAMAALQWNPCLHSEKQFDDEMEKLFNSLEVLL